MLCAGRGIDMRVTRPADDMGGGSPGHRVDVGVGSSAGVVGEGKNRHQEEEGEESCGDKPHVPRVASSLMASTGFFDGEHDTPFPCLVIM